MPSPRYGVEHAITVGHRLREQGHELAGIRLDSGDLADLIEQLSEQMRAAAGELQFEVAARLRDEIGDLKKELRSMLQAGV